MNGKLATGGCHISNINNLFANGARYYRFIAGSSTTKQGMFRYGGSNGSGDGNHILNDLHDISYRGGF